MCKFDKSFKLCSCSDQIDRNKPHWVLERMNININDMDMIHIGHFPFEYLVKLDNVIDELNNKNSFDFKYHPKQKDTLSLYFESDYFHLIFTNGKWREFSEYVGLRDNQKDFRQEGEIVIP